MLFNPFLSALRSRKSSAGAHLLSAAGLLLVYPGPVAEGIGPALVIAVVATQKIRKS